VLLVLGAALALVSLGVSGWQNTVSAGDFGQVIDVVNSLTNANLSWTKDFCGAVPLKFLSPLRFTFNFQNKAYNSPANCAWPHNSTTFRIVLGVFQVLLCALMLWRRVSFLSIPFASPTFLCFSFLWFSVFVLDSGNVASSNSVCANGSNVGQILLKAAGVPNMQGMQVVCGNAMYSLPPFIDLVLFMHTFVLGRAWAQCPGKYGIESDVAAEPEPAAVAPPPPPPLSKRTTGSWWRASDARLSELYPRQSHIGGTVPTHQQYSQNYQQGQQDRAGARQPTHAEMTQHGIRMSSSQYEKYSKIPGCLERILAYFGKLWQGGSEGEGGMQRDVEGARRGSINESFAHSIKGGSANRLNANAVGINVHSGTVNALVNSSPISRPLSTGNRPVFVNTAPPPSKPSAPPGQAGWSAADNEGSSKAGARPQSERQRELDWERGRATEEEEGEGVPEWLKQDDTKIVAEAEAEGEKRAPVSSNPFGDRPSEQEDAPPPPSSPPPSAAQLL
jgi:hypothetical protein